MIGNFETLTVAQDGRVLLVEVDAPPFNFMTTAMQLDLDRLTIAVAEDQSVGAVVVTGASAGRYITHFDIGAIQRAAEAAGASPAPDLVPWVIDGGMSAPENAEDRESQPEGLRNVTRFAEIVVRIMRSPAVWMAAISGPCGGGGLEMSVCFDARYASTSTDTVFVLPELLIGLTTTVGAQRLVQLLGPARALEMMLEGRAYNAQEAHELGLVNEVFAPEELLSSVTEKAHRYARRPRASVGAQKRVFAEVAALPLEESFRREGLVNAMGVVGGIAPVALSEWTRQQSETAGDSIFLTNPGPWVAGTAVDLNPEASSGDLESSAD